MKMQSKLTVNPEQHKTTQKAAPLKATTKSTFQVATPSLVKSIKETVALKVAPKVASKVKAAVKPVVTTISSKSHSHQTKAFRGSVKSPQLAQVINTASIKACPKTPTPISKAKIENTKPLVSKSESFLSYSNAVKGLRQEFSSLPEQHKTTQKAAPLKATTKSTFQVTTPSLVKSIKEKVALKVAPKVASKVKAAVKPVVTTISSKSHSHQSDQTKAFRGSVKSPQLAQVINTASIKACPKTPTPISKAKIENTKPLVSKSEPFLSYSNAVKGLRQEFSSLPELKCKETQTIGIVNNDASKQLQTALSSHIQESHKRELEFSKTPSREKEKISTEILQEFEKVLEFGTESNNTDNEPSNIVPKFYFEQGVLVHRNRNGEIVLTDTNNKPFTVGPQNSVLLKLYGRPSILVYVPGKVPSMPVKFMDINGEKHEITKCGIKEKEVIPIVLESVDSAICVDDKNGQIDKQIEVGSIKKNQGHLNAVNKAVEFIEKAFTTVLSKNARRRARNSGKKTL